MEPNGPVNNGLSENLKAGILPSNLTIWLRILKVWFSTKDSYRTRLHSSMDYIEFSGKCAWKTANFETVGPSYFFVRISVCHYGQVQVKKLLTWLFRSGSCSVRFFRNISSSRNWPDLNETVWPEQGIHVSGPFQVVPES